MTKKNTLKKSETDWARIDAMSDEEIDYSDIPKITDEMWENGILRKNFKPIPRKNQENLPIDKDIIEFFKARSFNYPAEINKILRAYMEEQKTN